MKKLSKVEKFLIQHADIEKYNSYRCAEHGVYQKRKDIDDKKCIYCKKENEPLDIEQMKKELGL